MTIFIGEAHEMEVEISVAVRRDLNMNRFYLERESKSGPDEKDWSFYLRLILNFERGEKKATWFGGWGTRPLWGVDYH
jgi:hypothetical protein